MHNSFLQKVVLTIVLSAFAGGLVQAYKIFVVRADRELESAKKVPFKFKN